MPTRTIVLAIFALAMAFSFYGTIDKPDCGDADFGAYYRAAVAVRAGQTPYQIDKHGPMGVYPYAPAYAYLLVPLTCLDYLWAFRSWLGLNWLATIAAFAIGLRLAACPPNRGPVRQTGGLSAKPGATPPNGGPLRQMGGLCLRAHRWRGGGGGERLPREDRWAVCLLAGVPIAGYLWANLRVGQAAMFVLLACLGWAYCQRRGRPFGGGLLLAAAGAVKLAPLVLVPWLLLRRDRRGLAGLGLGFTIIFLLPAVWLGFAETANLHLEWARHTIATHVPIQTYRPGNQSLLAQLARLPAIGNGHVCYSPENLSLLVRAYPLLLAGLAGGLYLLLWKRRATASTAIDNPSLALLLIFMTLVHPRAWRCNFVALLFPCLLLAVRVVRRERQWPTALAALGVVLLAGVWPTHGVGEGGWSLGAWLLLGKHFWAGAAVACACELYLSPSTTPCTRFKAQGPHFTDRVPHFTDRVPISRTGPRFFGEIAGLQADCS